MGAMSEAVISIQYSVISESENAPVNRSVAPLETDY